jgi:hypothetical protein
MPYVCAVYGLAAAVFSQDINRALETAHKLKAGTAWVRDDLFLSYLLVTDTSTGQLCQPTSRQRAFWWLQAVRYWT